MSTVQKKSWGRSKCLLTGMILLAVACVVSVGGYLGVKLYRQWNVSANGRTIPVNTTENTGASGVETIMSGDPQNISVILNEGQPQPTPAATLPVVTGEPLSDEETQRILNRLPVITVEPSQQVDFKLPGDPIPPPLPGDTVSEPFPPESPVEPADVAASGPLEVLRHAPEGEVAIAPFVNVTFNQPMVPLGTLEDLAAEDVPVQIEPQLAGTWRWLGTRTLSFEYDSDLIDRLPKSTEYHVRIPAGTRSATGGVLAKAVEWTFTTPPAKVVTTYPYNEPQPLNPLFFVAFDQRINPAAVLETIRVTADSQKVDVVMASEAELKADKTVGSLSATAQESRWLAFRAKEPLPADTIITVTIGPGTPSAEGSLKTVDAQTYSFRTYAPLRINDHGCYWSDDPCRPLTPLYIRLNNPIDAAAYQDAMLRIAPDLPGASVNVVGDTIEIHGATRGQTTYTMVVSGDLKDTFGQVLGKDATLTFQIGPAESRLAGPSQTFMTIDPAAKKPEFSVYAINYSKLDVQIYAVQPSDWPAYKQYLMDFQQENSLPKPPGRRVRNDSQAVESAADALTEVKIDLSKEMDGAYGHFIVIVSPPKGLFQNVWDWRYQTVTAWVQITQIGLDAFVDHSEMVVWTTALKDGAALANVKVSSSLGSALATTDEDGVARFNIPSGATYLVASQGSDQAMLPNSTYLWGDSSWRQRPVSDELRWYVFDDRQMYRPGEEVHVKGWLRRVGGKQTGDVGLVGSLVKSVSFRVVSSQGNDLGSGTADVNALGGFDFVITLPEEVNLGYTQLILDASSASQFSGWEYYHSFQIQEFRTPEFEVTARNETEPPYFAGGSAIVAVEAAYYAGGALPNAEVTWQVSSTPSSYSPPNWPDFVFGVWQPWWRFYDYYSKGTYDGGTTYESFSGQTDATGTHYLELDFAQLVTTRPVSILAEASVMDVNRQSWSGTTSLLVHPASLYVGLRSERMFVERGQPLEISVIVTDLDGKPVVDRPIEVRAARLDWKYGSNGWQEEEVDAQTCTVGSKQEPVSCTFQTTVGGSYRITATVTDDKGRKNQSQFTRWVSGGQRPPSRKVEQEEATLIPDKENYQPGDTARILVQSPFSPAEGLLTVSRSGLLYTQSFHIDEGTIVLEVPIEAAHIPNLNIQVDLAGSAARVDDQGNLIKGVDPRPAYATGALNLSIPPYQRALSLDVQPDVSELAPGGETNLTVVVKDANGQPVADAELAVIVVDEAILALTSYSMSDPLALFYTDRSADLSSLYSRANIVLLDPQSLIDSQAADQMAMATQTVEMMDEKEVHKEYLAAAPAMDAVGARQDEAQPMIAIRSNFNPLAVFSPAVHTGADGVARISVKLPDNLTRYRVMVVAVSGGQQFGMGESNLTARLPLMVRPSAPRFLNFGDQFELPVVLQNQTNEPLVVDVAVRATNLNLTGSAGLRVTVPARDRVEVRFPASTQMAGTAVVQIAAVSGSYVDAASVTMPVYTPATTEAFATYGVLDEGSVAQPVLAPQGVFPQYGGLEINTSSTALQALTDAVLYLVSYPYECSEQLSSRILAVAALRDVLTAFEADGLPSPAAMESAVQRDIERLRGIQNYDGGFPYWRRGYESIPFNTIHVAHALYRAEQKGFTVPSDMKQMGLEYLRQIENYYPAWYGQQTRWTLSSYALYVRNLMGDGDPEKAVKLIKEAGLEKLSLEAVGWLWPVLQDAPNTGEQLDAIRHHVNNRVVETAGAANFTTHYDDQTYLLLSSDRRTDAILLDALIIDNPQSDVIPKLVTGLLAHRTKGRWYNTQENVFALLALDRYFNTFESQTPDFVARFWLGETYVGSHKYEGRTTERIETEIPMAYLVDEDLGGGGMQDLILSKEGPGRLYYRLGLRYAPTDLQLDPLDMGFVVQRRYEAVDDPGDVYQDKEGAWHIKAGARVRVRITMVADNRRYHVALVDPLPAGLEIVNPALAVSGSAPQDPSEQSPRYWWWWTWYEHQNLRDERAEAFTSLLWDGVYEYTYITRATTPGVFVVPPAKAEEMYSPEVFGRSASDTVIVEDR